MTSTPNSTRGMRLHAGCELLFEATGPSSLILMLRPRSGLGQSVVIENNICKPDLESKDFIDVNGNLCQRVVTDKGSCRIESTVVVDTTDYFDVAPGAAFVPVHDLPVSALPFLLPSRYCQSDLFREFAQKITQGKVDGYDQVEAIRSWIYANIEYRYGSSSASTSAIDTFHARVGVCRDSVHLGIALCRGLSIPARMVVGYLHKLEPMDLHAWFEAYVGGRWYTFDATQAQPVGSRIAIGYGRDAADVALATQYGPINLTEMRVWVHAAKS
jgi:transglutaminase-like putative cysteine protease